MLKQKDSQRNFLKYLHLVVGFLITLFIFDMIQNTYSLLWWLHIHGFAPLYIEWLKCMALDVISIFLLAFYSLRVWGFGLVLLIMLYNFMFLFKTGTMNIIFWIKSENILGAIDIFFWWVALFLSILGLLFWWKLRKTQK